MSITKYFAYYTFLLLRWNARIATHIIRHEWRGEQEYGINSSGADELRSLTKKGIDISHATFYMPAPYDMLEQAFTKFNIGNSNHLLDIGCGKGRALCVAAHFGARKLTGIDFHKGLCDAAIKNLQKVQQKLPRIRFDVQNTDAFYFNIPADVDCIFMFNPFDEVIMSGVVQNIHKSLQKRPRKLTVIYMNPLEKHLFLQNGFTEVYHFKKLRYLEISVLQN